MATISRLCFGKTHFPELLSPLSENTEPPEGCWNLHLLPNLHLPSRKNLHTVFDRAAIAPGFVLNQQPRFDESANE